MKLSYLFLSLLLSLPFPAFACLNDYKPNKQAVARSRSLIEQLTEQSLKEDWSTRETRLRKEFANSGDYRVKNDLATTLTHTGKAAEAVELLEQIEAEKPGLYMTASNLGTAYELSGNNEKAIEWIRKGIERNPEAHEGTEWLHVRILEAKIALSKDPKWLESNSVFGALESGKPEKETSERRPKIVATGNRNEKLSDTEIKKALIHQLHERLQFVNPPEGIVGSLLLDLGDLVSNEKTGIRGALDVYVLAQQYLTGLPNVESLYAATQFRLHQIHHEGRSGITNRSLGDFALIGGCGLLLGVLIIAGIRRLRGPVAG